MDSNATFMLFINGLTEFWRLRQGHCQPVMPLLHSARFSPPD
jgi:hypothetical protein